MLESSDNDLFEKTRREARRGASLVLWPEASVIALGAERHDELLAALAALADEEDVCLGTSLAYIPDDPAELNRNRIPLLGADGRAVGEYHETRLIPQVEEPFTRQGTGAVAAVDTALGRLGLAICYDLDDPAFVRAWPAPEWSCSSRPSGTGTRSSTSTPPWHGSEPSRPGCRC